MADLPLAPGQPYVEVEYDYEYKSKNRLISIHQGEHYLLVKKSNEDWWQVRRDDGSKPFYVPAQYVREVRKALMPPMPPSKPLMPPERPGPAPSDPAASAPAPARVKPTSLDLPAGGAVSRGDSTSRRSPGHRERDSPLHSPHSRGRSPELQRQPLDVDSRHGNDSGDERRTNESESELSSSSTEMLQSLPALTHSGSASSAHAALQELKLSDWDLRRDPSGRPFYVNRVTLERSWKPPRGREQGAEQGGERAEPGAEKAEPGSERAEPGAETSVSLCLFPLPSLSEEHSAPWGPADAQCGWSEETDEFGHAHFWLQTVDDQGRQYFYSADGSRSEWELPKLNNSPPHLTAEGAKTRSLDRRAAEPIVLTKWRHSTHIPEPPEKDSVAGLWVEPGPESPSSPKPPSSPSEKCGVLNMTKITEHGKKVRKNWTSSWTVLQGSTLLFTKGQAGGSSWFGGQSKPELTVDLRGASVDWAPKDRSSKKNVVELKTRQGTELLIQSDSEALVQDWLQALQDSISTHAWESDEGLEDDLPESPGRDDKSDREQRESRRDRGVKSSSSLDVSENKKTRHRLKRFLTRRPTLQAVRDKGYIKDQVFGCSLSALCQRENSTVPRFVKMCIEHVETDGLSVDGLYRVSGNLAVIQKLRFAVNHDERVNLSDSKWEDIHVTTGALKMFFRDLPEPLFPYGLFHDFVSAIKSPDYRHRVQSIKDLVQQLPEENHDTMQALFRHLRRVVDHGDDNRMTIQSVAIVFGPTLLRPETETWNMAVHMVYQNQIVELILIECESIFEW